MNLKKIFLFIGGISLVILSFLSLFRFSPKNVDSRPYAAVSTISKYGLIEHQDAWQESLQESDYGRKPKDIKELNHLIQAANKHSSIMEFATIEELDRFDELNFPNVATYDDVTVINVPSFYSMHSKYHVTYAKKLAELIENSSDHIILNLANNHGGLPNPMIIGASALIPDGLLYNEVDNQGNRYPLFLENGKLWGGIDESATRMQPLKKGKKLDKKVAVITNELTASAAEALLLALKNNPNVKIFGTPTTGYTSVNSGRYISGPKSNLTWWLVYTSAYYELTQPLHGQVTFNNQKISPDSFVEFSTIHWSNQEIIDSPSRQKLFQEMNDWFNES